MIIPCSNWPIIIAGPIVLDHNNIPIGSKTQQIKQKGTLGFCHLGFGFRIQAQNDIN